MSSAPADLNAIILHVLDMKQAGTSRAAMAGADPLSQYCSLLKTAPWLILLAGLRSGKAALVGFELLGILRRDGCPPGLAEAARRIIRSAAAASDVLRA